MTNRSWQIALALGAVLLMLILPNRVSDRVKGGLRELLAPLHAALSGVAWRAQDAAATVRGFGGLVGENRRMAAELVRLRIEAARLEALEEENERLREMLAFARASPRRLLPAEVMARDASGWWQTVRLNRGARDGVTVSAAVVTIDGLAGRTLAVSDRTTDVLLISDPNCRVSVRLPRTGAFGVLSGTGVSWSGQALCRLDLVNRHLAVRAGDEVVTSGLGGVFPEGLTVGYVETAEPDAAGLVQRATVVPHADLGRIRTAFVVLAPPGESAGREANP